MLDESMICLTIQKWYARQDSLGCLTTERRKVYVAAPLEVTQEVFMRACLLLALSISGLMVSACSNTEWVHPNKPSDEYTNDYNKCQNLVMRDPKLQQGNQLLILNATERCMQKDGWRLVER